MLLTIAIPTYNRLDFLKETIDAIIPQIIDCNHQDSLVELLVCDNASTDDTRLYLSSLVRKYEFIRVHEETTNGGIDNNIHNCALYAKGDYVFSLSDDDIPARNTIEKIVKYIEAKEDIFIFLNGYVFNGAYDGVITNDVIFKEKDNDVIFYDKQEFVDRIGVWATFVSSFVYKRDIWLKAAEGNRFIGTDIYLTYVLYSMLRFCPKMVIISKPLIAIRAQYSGNYKILKAFCIEFGRLLHEVSVSEWGYDIKRNNEIFRKSIYANLINKIIDVRSLPSSHIPEDEKYRIKETLRTHKCELLLVSCMMTLPVVFIRIIKRVLNILGLKTSNFNI